MKTKNQLTIIILMTGLLVTGIVYGEDPVKSAGNDATATGSGTNMGWQEQTRRTNVIITDGMRLNTGFSANTNGVSWTIGVSSNLTVIECCKPTTLRQSWCNYNADDEKCDN